ncbi:hypothetical protein FHR24_000392 [Wenyingzhuangia heitensis]|uniref:Lipoprotein n=1 Tax=Wenyingzhuangia heitensis TaxID=1487859 RepID=A0ABX0U6Z3_9FLAO|nr:hypothetical protein [Wenyingzhuangia heitensis]NIJ43953.1 hypothetical protein [Wenyingzhuangia heitensis]
MKKLLLIIVAVLAVGCSTYSVTSSKGIENQSFLVFKETTTNYQVVDVKINNGDTFYAKPYNRGDEIPDEKIEKEKLKKASKGKVFSVPTGKSKISVFYQEKKIYEKILFLNNQEVRTIVLP